MNALISLIAAVAILAAGVAGVQTWRLDDAQDDLRELQESINQAAQDSALRGATTAVEAVSNYVDQQEADAPVIERVVTRTRNVCLQQPAANRVPVPTVAPSARQADAEAQDDADRAAWLGAVADDLSTCAAALNRCDSIRQFHNANVGAPR